MRERNFGSGAGASRTTSRPSARPGAGSGSTSRPSARPSAGGSGSTSRPSARPSAGGSGSTSRPSARPSARPGTGDGSQGSYVPRPTRQQEEDTRNGREAFPSDREEALPERPQRSGGRKPKHAARRLGSGFSLLDVDPRFWLVGLIVIAIVFIGIYVATHPTEVAALIGNVKVFLLFLGKVLVIALVIWAIAMFKFGRGMSGTARLILLIVFFLAVLVCFMMPGLMESVLYVVIVFALMIWIIKKMFS